MNEQKSESTLAKKGGISVETAHIFPVIKKWLYSEKDIFLRELVSNAADAVTKHKRLCSLGQAESDGTAYRIDVRLDASAKTLTVSDNGIGMTEEELLKYLGSIALSGAMEFIQKYEGDQKEGKVTDHAPATGGNPAGAADPGQCRVRSFRLFDGGSGD